MAPDHSPSHVKARPSLMAFGSSFLKVVPKLGQSAPSAFSISDQELASPCCPIPQPLSRVCPAPGQRPPSLGSKQEQGHVFLTLPPPASPSSLKIDTIQPHSPISFKKTFKCKYKWDIHRTGGDCSSVLPEDEEDVTLQQGKVKLQCRLLPTPGLGFFSQLF